MPATALRIFFYFPCSSLEIPLGCFKAHDNILMSRADSDCYSVWLGQQETTPAAVGQLLKHFSSWSNHEFLLWYHKRKDSDWV